VFGRKRGIHSKTKEENDEEVGSRCECARVHQLDVSLDGGNKCCR